MCSVCCLAWPLAKCRRRNSCGRKISDTHASELSSSSTNSIGLVLYGFVIGQHRSGRYSSWLHCFKTSCGFTVSLKRLKLTGTANGSSSRRFLSDDSGAVVFSTAITTPLATAGPVALKLGSMPMPVFICTCFLFCIANYCYAAIRLLSRKCGIKLSVSVSVNACRYTTRSWSRALVDQWSVSGVTKLHFQFCRQKWKAHYRKRIVYFDAVVSWTVG